MPVTIQENVSLLPYHTFGIEVSARYFATINTVDEMRELLQDPRFRPLPKLILGGGSNVLFTSDFPGLVIRNQLKGIGQVREDAAHVWVRAMSGEVWHELVLYCLDHDLAGIENLSLIPGTVGAAPMQNIGAYGVELREVFEELEAMNLETGEIEKFDHEQCQFGYRESIFKKEAKGRYFITAVTLRLNKVPEFNVSYGAIRNTLDEKGISDLSIRVISEAICEIRRSKLPDPAVLGNSGSFFKNPEIPQEQFKQLKAQFPEIVGYELPNGKVKVAAGWLIEQCGWKGKRVGETGSHARQALVLVNYGHAQGADVARLAADIQRSVKEKFGIELKPEVNIY